MLHWGLVPFWSKESKTKRILINARAEGIETKPSFRSPFRHRRCVIPASGFYEWMYRDGKQPYFIRPAGKDYFAMAGIWEHWQGQNGEVVDSVAIITTAANKVMAPIHDRMPAILAENNLPE
jgi:putative SOS response-associated peptidase YedK